MPQDGMLTFQQIWVTTKNLDKIWTAIFSDSEVANT